MAADFQNEVPNPCNLSRTGYFGSKFVTVCVSGDENHQISLKGYQVSNQCMALVRDNCLVPTLDAPELGYVRESTSEQYVPDVFYKTKDEYGEVTRLARPLPLEYLIIELTTTTPIKPKPLLPGGKGHFPVTNREFQNFDGVVTYLSSQSGVPFLSYMADFHFLLYLYQSDMLGIDFKPHLPELCDAICRGDKLLGDRWRQKECWATLEQLIKASADSPTQLSSARFPSARSILPPIPSGSRMSTSSASVTATAAEASGGGGDWSCQHCTYLNQSHRAECEVCHLPRTH